MKCERAGCNRHADLRDERGLLTCSKHAETRCTCGRWMPERMAADGLACDTCTLEASESADLEGWPWLT